MTETKPAKDPAKETEQRTTFTAPITEIGRIRTAIEAECFKLNLTVATHKIGGILEQTWGLQVKGKEKSMEAFQLWFDKEFPKLIEPDNMIIAKLFG